MDDTYYTDNHLAMPLKVLWRHVWRATHILSPVVFSLFMLQKLFRLTPQATYGVRPSESLPVYDEDEVPTGVYHRLNPRIEDLEELGFEFQYYLSPELIGAKREFNAILLDPKRLCWASIVWFKLTIGEQTESRLIVSMHSRLRNGVTVHTTALADKDLDLELLPPNHQMLKVPPDTTAEELLEDHMEHLQPDREQVMPVNEETLDRLLMQEAREIYEYFIEHGYYRPLTEREVERLM